MRSGGRLRASALIAAEAGTVGVPGRLLRSCLHADLPARVLTDAHRALAAVLDPDSARLARALHRLAAATGPAEETAADLDAAVAAERGAGDHRSSATALERAAALTGRPDLRARWLVAAAADTLLTEELRRSRELLRQVVPRCASQATRGLRMLVRGEIELRDGVPGTACRDLSQAAGLLPSDQRELTLRALMLAGEAGCLAGDFAGYFALAEHTAGLRRSDDPPALALVFDHFEGMAATFQGRHEAANRALRQVLRLAEVVRDPEATVWASQAAYTLGDGHTAHALAARAVHDARETGALHTVPAALVFHALAALMLDRYAAAEAAALEGLRIAEATGQRNLRVDHLAILALLAALQGDEQTAAMRLRSTTRDTAERELGRPFAFNCWSFACVDLAMDRPADALGRFGRMTTGGGQANLAIRGMAAPHFVEAAARCGRRAEAGAALRSYQSWAAAGSGSSTRLALAHRCHGLLAEGDQAAEEHFAEAMRLHHEDNTALEMAKTGLFYAHRLRRARKPGLARGMLRDALRVFEQFEARLWADRATAELRAAGGGVGPVARPEGGELTAQQLRISGLVAQGATNGEIAELLVLSTRTVEYHLRNVFTRLGVRSRVELAALFH